MLQFDEFFDKKFKILICTFCSFYVKCLPSSFARAIEQKYLQFLDDIFSLFTFFFFFTR